MRWVLALLLLPSLATAQIADTTARPISLDEAVTLARRNAPQSVQARGTTRTSAAAVRSAYASFIPNFSLSMGSTFQGGDRFDSQGQLVPFVGQAWQYNGGLQANVELFDGGRRLFELRGAKANVNSAEANETLQEFRVALDVKQQYYNVLAARESESAALAQLEQARQQLRAAVARLAAGAATKSDSLRSEILVGNARLALLTAQNDLRVANASLTRLVATPFLVTADSTAGSDEVPLALDSARIAQLALRGPAVVQAEASLAAARAAERAARTPYLPTISVNYSRSGNGTDSRFGFGNERYAYSENLRFSLSYPLFNQLGREESVVRARVAEDVAEAQVRDARFVAQQSLTQFVGALRTAQARVDIQLASVAAAEEDLRVQQQRYSLGASTLLDVLTSQTQLNQARASLIQARYDARVARAQIEALIGQDVP